MGREAAPAGNAVVAAKVTGPSAFAVMSRAAYWALVVPSGSDWVRNRNVPLSVVSAFSPRVSTMAKERREYRYFMTVFGRCACVVDAEGR